MDNSAMSQFSVDTSQYAPTSETLYDSKLTSGSDFWDGFGNVVTFGAIGRGKNKALANIQEQNVAKQNALDEARLQSARQYEMYMDSTKYQRAVEDAKKAGINPYLLFSNNINTSSGSSASAISSHSVNKADKANGSSSIVSAALKVLAMIILKS